MGAKITGSGGAQSASTSVDRGKSPSSKSKSKDYPKKNEKKSGDEKLKEYNSGSSGSSGSSGAKVKDQSEAEIAANQRLNSDIDRANGVDRSKADYDTNSDYENKITANQLINSDIDRENGVDRVDNIQRAKEAFEQGNGQIPSAPGLSIEPAVKPLPTREEALAGIGITKTTGNIGYIENPAEYVSIMNFYDAVDAGKVDLSKYSTLEDALADHKEQQRIAGVGSGQGKLNTMVQTQSARGYSATNGYQMSDLSKNIYGAAHNFAETVRRGVKTEQFSRLPGSSVLQYPVRSTAGLVEMGGMIPGGVETMVDNPNVISSALAVGAYQSTVGTAQAFKDDPLQTTSDIVTGALLLGGGVKAVSKIPVGKGFPKAGGRVTTIRDNVLASERANNVLFAAETQKLRLNQAVKPVVDKLPTERASVAMNELKFRASDKANSVPFKLEMQKGKVNQAVKPVVDKLPTERASVAMNELKFRASDKANSVPFKLETQKLKVSQAMKPVVDKLPTERASMAMNELKFRASDKANSVPFKLETQKLKVNKLIENMKPEKSSITYERYGVKRKLELSESRTISDMFADTRGSTDPVRVQATAQQLALKTTVKPALEFATKPHTLPKITPAFFAPGIVATSMSHMPGINNMAPQSQIVVPDIGVVGEQTKKERRDVKPAIEFAINTHNSSQIHPAIVIDSIPQVTEPVVDNIPDQDIIPDTMPVSISIRDIANLQTQTPVQKQTQANDALQVADSILIKESFGFASEIPVDLPTKRSKKQKGPASSGDWIFGQKKNKFGSIDDLFGW